MNNVPAVKGNTELAFRIGGQEIKVPEQTKKILLTRGPNGWVADEIARLGEDDVFVRRDGNQELSLIYKSVLLYHNKKEIARLGNKDDSPWVITVAGYTKLNQIAGLHIITPPIIFVAGGEHSNPYVEYVNGEIRRVIARKIAIGYSPIGNLVAIDAVRHYNFEAYYLQDLMAKAKYKQAAARFGTVLQCPFAPNEQVQKEEGHAYVKTTEGKIFVFKLIKDLEGIWFDPSSEEILQVNDQHIQHQKFGDVVGQKMCARNALKDHPAIAAQQVIPVNGVAEVRVFGFRHGLIKEQFQKMADQIIKGEEVEGVQVQQDEGEESLEEVQAATESEVDETVVPTESSPAVQTAVPVATDGAKPEGSVTVFRIKEIATKKGMDLNKFAGNMFEGKKFDALTEPELEKLLKVVETTSMGKKGEAK